MLTPYTENQKKRISNNIIRATEDINKLSKQSYKYLYLCSGFIAHYSYYGFIHNYHNESLKNDLLLNKSMNIKNNRTPEEIDFKYYQSKCDIYKNVTDWLN